MNNTISISTSTKKTLGLIGSGGETLGTVIVDPGDIHIVDRYEEVVGKLDGLREQYDSKDGGFHEQAEAIRELENTAREQVNYLLGYDAAESVFSKMSALHMNDEGEFYFQQVITGVGAYIAAEISNRSAAKMAKVEAATAKYNKKNQ